MKGRKLRAGNQSIFF